MENLQLLTAVIQLIENFATELSGPEKKKPALGLVDFMTIFLFM